MEGGRDGGREEGRKGGRKGGGREEGRTDEERRREDGRRTKEGGRGREREKVVHGTLLLWVLGTCDYEGYFNHFTLYHRPPPHTMKFSKKKNGSHDPLPLLLDIPYKWKFSKDLYLKNFTGTDQILDLI